MARREITHGQLKMVDHSTWLPEYLLDRTGYRELPIGSIVFYARGYADYDDLYSVELRSLPARETFCHDLTLEFWENSYGMSHGINWKQLNEVEEMQLMGDTLCMYCMGGEL